MVNNEQGGVPNYYDEGITLKEFVYLLKENILVIISSVLFFLILVVGYTWFLVTPQYTAKESVVYDTYTMSPEIMSFVRTLLPMQEDLIKSPKFVEEIITIIEARDDSNGFDLTVDQVIASIKTDLVDNRFKINITVTTTDPHYSYLIADTIGKKFEETTFVNIENVKMESRNLAKVPASPSKPNKVLNIIISLLLGFVVGIMIVMLKLQFGEKFKSLDEIKRVVKYPVIGEIYQQERDN